jgi:ABC-type antimicrobial peptide transport system permease subunit
MSVGQAVAQLSGFFGLLAVFLACMGTYGRMSFSGNRRTNEIGIRMVLGASQSDVLSMVVKGVVTLVAIGLAVGIPLTLASSRLISSLLFDLKPTDPLIFATVTVVLLAVTAWRDICPRALRVDPVIALRYE